MSLIGGFTTVRQNLAILHEHVSKVAIYIFLLVNCAR